MSIPNSQTANTLNVILPFSIVKYYSLAFCQGCLMEVFSKAVLASLKRTPQTMALL